MTREEIRAEADEAARAFAARLAADEAATTGIPKPVEIIVSETQTNVERFGLDLEPETAAATFPGQPGPPPPGTPPACGLSALAGISQLDVHWEYAIVGCGCTKLIVIDHTWTRVPTYPPPLDCFMFRCVDHSGVLWPDFEATSMTVAGPGTGPGVEVTENNSDHFLEVDLDINSANPTQLKTIVYCTAGFMAGCGCNPSPDQFPTYDFWTLAALIGAHTKHLVAGAATLDCTWTFS